MGDWISQTELASTTFQMQPKIEKGKSLIAGILKQYPVSKHDDVKITSWRRCCNSTARERNTYRRNITLCKNNKDNHSR